LATPLVFPLTYWWAGAGPEKPTLACARTGVISDPLGTPFWLAQTRKFSWEITPFSLSFSPFPPPPSPRSVGVVLLLGLMEILLVYYTTFPKQVVPLALPFPCPVGLRFCSLGDHVCLPQPFQHIRFVAFPSLWHILVFPPLPRASTLSGTPFLKTVWVTFSPPPLFLPHKNTPPEHTEWLIGVPTMSGLWPFLFK